jgi:hypothetical protein
MAIVAGWRYLKSKLTPMIIILSVAGIITLVAAVVLVVGLVTAPDGHEDLQGFHAMRKTEPQETTWCSDELGGNRPSHSLKG